MSNDSDKKTEITAGKPIGEGIKNELHKVPNSPFVDWRPHQDEAALLRMMMGPLANTAGKIDAELARLANRIAALEQRSPFRSCADIET
jgi:hypothetical protein